MNSLPVDAFSFHHPFLTHATREFTYRYSTTPFPTRATSECRVPNTLSDPGSLGVYLNVSPPSPPDAGYIREFTDWYSPSLFLTRLLGSLPTSRVGNGISFRTNSAEETRNGFRYSAEESAHSEAFRVLRKSQFRSSEGNRTKKIKF